jgi:superfamily II DNA helicase RecQ
MSFHGLGLGSLRFTELDQLKISCCLWHRGTVYFHSTSLKKFSHKTHSQPNLKKKNQQKKLPTAFKKKVQHKIPPSIARVFLLFRKIVASLDVFDSHRMIPKRTESNHSMNIAVAELFGFSQVPDSTQVRHLWTSMLNYIFPEGDLSGALCAEEMAAESSGHAASTHRDKYSSELIGGREYLYKKFHAALGEQAAGATISNLMIRGVDLKSALRVLIGPDAEYTSVHQQELVEFAALSTSEHGHADLPCGSGKSMAWTLPVAARLLSQRQPVSGKCTVVVLPYKFLAAFQTKATSSFLLECMDAWIATYSASDFCANKIPDELAHGDVLPDIVFLTIDALAMIMEKHMPLFARLCRSGHVHCFIIDEIHTLLTEGFHPAYESLTRLPSFHVPILTMSGSLPSQFRSSLLRYLGMSSEDDDGCSGEVHLLGGGDVLGYFPHDFSFSCTVMNDPKAATVRSALSFIRRNPDHAVHIMVSSKLDIASIASEISKASISHRVLTSEVDREQQEAIADDWRNSQFSILISSSIAIVGNENPKCRHLVLNGYLFNIITIVQAINRLRPKQRWGGSSVMIYLPHCNESYLDEWWEKKEKPVFMSLSGKGLIPRDEDLWKKFGSLSGLHQWLVLQDGCRIANLSTLYGTRRKDCGICDRCKGTQVHRAAMTNQTKVIHQHNTKNLAMNVIRRLEQKCVICCLESCDGEKCLPRGSCFNCGSTDHRKKSCTTDWKDLLNCKGCYYCLDLYSREGYKQCNGGKTCPLQRRLKRLVIYQCQAANNTCIDIFYAKITSNLAMFYSFLAQTPRAS